MSPRQCQLEKEQYFHPQIDCRLTPSTQVCEPHAITDLISTKGFIWCPQVNWLGPLAVGLSTAHSLRGPGQEPKSGYECTISSRDLNLISSSSYRPDSFFSEQTSQSLLISILVTHCTMLSNTVLLALELVTLFSATASAQGIAGKCTG